MIDLLTSRRLTALLACLAVLVVAGCGADEEEPKGDPIPAAQVQALQVRLDEIERRFDFGNGACNDIQEDSRPAVQQILRSIPNTVAADVRSSLSDSFDRLFSLSDEQCDEKKVETTNTTPETTPETTTTETVTVPTTPTETTPTQPTTPTTPTETTPPQTTTTPPTDGGSNGGGGVAPPEGQ